MASSSGCGSRGSHDGRSRHGRGMIVGGVERVRAIEGSG